MTNPLGHIDLRVNNMEKATAFYSRLLPQLGFIHRESDKGWEVFYTNEVPLPDTAFFGFTEETGYVPNATRLAFWRETQAEVDGIAMILPEIGALEIDGPQLMPEYGDMYYAVFFEDPSGNKLEVYYRNQH